MELDYGRADLRMHSGATDNARGMLQKLWFVSMAATVVASTAAFALTPDSVSFLRTFPWSAATVAGEEEASHISIRAGVHAVLYESDINERTGAAASKEYGVIDYHSGRCHAYLDQATCDACATSASYTTMGVWVAIAFMWVSLVPEFQFTFERPTQGLKTAITTLSLCGISTMVFSLHHFHTHCHSVMGHHVEPSLGVGFTAVAVAMAVQACLTAVYAATRLVTDPCGFFDTHHHPKFSPTLAHSSHGRVQAMTHSSEMQSIASTVFEMDKRPVVLFDGVCNLCNNAVNTAIDLDASSHGKVRFAALQSKVGQSLLHMSGRSPDDISSIVLVEPTRSFFKSDAVLRIAQILESPVAAFGNVGLLVPGFVRDSMYDVVANNRYRIFGESDQCRMSEPNLMSRFVPEPEEAAPLVSVPKFATSAYPHRAPARRVVPLYNSEQEESVVTVSADDERDNVDMMIRKFRQGVNMSGHLRDLKNKQYFETNQMKEIRKKKEAGLRKKFERPWSSSGGPSNPNGN